MSGTRYFEKQIVNQVVKDALEAGYSLEVDAEANGEVEYKGTDAEKAVKALFEFDDAYLFLLETGEPEGGKRWVRFVFGNSGWDVINNYTVNLEELLTNANKLADEFEK